MLTDIVNVSISLDTTGVQQAGFGVPIFIGAHRWFPERFRSYNNIQAVSEDIPTDSDEYRAALAFFSQTPSPSVIEIGRRDADINFTPVIGVEGTTYEFSFVAGGSEIRVVYTSEEEDNAEAIVDGLILSYQGSGATDFADVTKSGADDAAILVVSPINGESSFGISNYENLTYTAVPGESAGDVLAAIEEEGSSAYYIAAHDHTESFVMEMAAAVEAREKVYAVSSQDPESLTALEQTSTDVLALLNRGNYFRTITMFHHEADTNFPECAYLGMGAPYAPGTLTWANNRLGGVSASSDPNTGRRLTYTQRNNLASRNANFLELNGGVAITRQGKVAAGEWIDVITSRDLLVARIKESYQAKLINTPKVPYTDSGINSMRSVLVSTLDRYVSTDSQPNILQENNPYRVFFPRANEVSFNDKAERRLEAQFVAYMAGAIHVVEIHGTLTYDAQS